jgi:hypothetical protein
MGLSGKCGVAKVAAAGGPGRLLAVCHCHISQAGSSLLRVRQWQGPAGGDRSRWDSRGTEVPVGRCSQVLYVQYAVVSPNMFSQQKN